MALTNKICGDLIGAKKIFDEAMTLGSTVMWLLVSTVKTVT